MKVYIEEVEDYSTHGVTAYSLVQGMHAYMAEVRASGITIWHSEDYDQGKSLDSDDEKYKELSKALTEEMYRNV